MTAYWSELQAYRSPDGLVNIIPNQQNGAVGNSCYTWAAFWLAFKRGEANIDILQDFEKTARGCYVPNNPGLLYRSPSKTQEMEGWDDYTVLMAAAGKQALNSAVASELFKCATDHKFVLNCLEPGKLTNQSFMARYPQLIDQFYKAVGKCAPFPFGLLAAGLNAIPVKDGDNDGIVLSFFRRVTVDHTYQDARMQAALSLWMGINGAPNLEHPLVKYWV